MEVLPASLWLPSIGTKVQSPLSSGTQQKILSLRQPETTIKSRCGIWVSNRTTRRWAQTHHLRMYHLSYCLSTRASNISRRFTGTPKYLVPWSAQLTMASMSLRQFPCKQLPYLYLRSGWILFSFPPIIAVTLGRKSCLLRLWCDCLMHCA